jgi:hypothetical protein
MIKKIIFLIILIEFICIIDIIATKAKRECSFDHALIDNNQVILTDFTNFNQIDFNCKNPINMSIFTIHPAKKIILDNSFKLKNTSIIATQKMFTINLRNFIGFDLSANPFKSMKLIHIDNIYIAWSIEESNLNFIYKNISFDSQCDSKLIEDTKWINYLFSGFSTIIDYSNQYLNPICPFLFKNTKLQYLKINWNSVSLIDKNEFSILKLNDKEEKKIELNSNILNLEMLIYRTSLTNKILNKHVFKQLNMLQVSGIINSIQFDLFKDFKNLQLLIIRMQYIKNIFIKKNNWIKYLNYNRDIDLSKVFFNEALFLVLYQSFYRTTFYTYPEEDICYFKDFPHSKLVLPILKPNNNVSSCTCTQLYLIQYSYLFKDQFDYSLRYVQKSYELVLYYSDIVSQESLKDCYNENIEQRIIQCDFRKRLSTCNIESIKKEDETDSFYFTIEDWELLSKLSHYYIFILNQVVSLICLFSNIIFIIVISNKNISKEFKKTYKYLKIYTILNSIYIIILFTKFICFKDMFFCYITKNSIYIQYFKLISVRLICNILSTASNITYVSFTLSRYIAVTNTKLRILKLFGDISFKFYFFILTIFSIFINIYMFFISSIRNETSIFFQGKTFSLKNLTNSYERIEIDYYKTNLETTSFNLFKSLQIVKIIFSDILYIILVFLIDMLLLFFVTKQMKKKKEISTTHIIIALTPFQISNSAVVNPNNSFLNMIRKRRQHEITEKKLTCLIILNGINFLVFKLPSALIKLYSFIYYYDQINKQYKPSVLGYIVCRYFNFCESVAELAHLLYLFSYLIQFFIFYKLDKNFHDHFLALKSKISNCS